MVKTFPNGQSAGCCGVEVRFSLSDSQGKLTMLRMTFLMFLVAVRALVFPVATTSPPATNVGIDPLDSLKTRQKALDDLFSRKPLIHGAPFVHKSVVWNIGIGGQHRLPHRSCSK